LCFIASMMSEVPPRVVAALNTQLGRWRAALGRGERRIGWKIGLNFPEVEDVIGGDPIIGHLCQRHPPRDGRTYTAHDSPNLAKKRGRTTIRVPASASSTISSSGASGPTAQTRCGPPI
jgi:hypothetical protein